MRRILSLLALALAVGVGVAACNSQGTVAPFPETIEGTLEEPEIAIGNATDGAGIFISAGCGSCHALAELAEATGAIGPNLTVSLAGKDAAYVQQGIINPDAVLAEGFDGGLMPSTYGDSLSETELADIVALLLASAAG